MFKASKFVAGVAAVIGLIAFTYRDLIWPPAQDFETLKDQSLPPAALIDESLKETTLDAVVAQNPKDKTLLVLWATWCEPCVRELPMIATMSPLAQKKGVHIVLLNYDGGNPDKTIPEVRAWKIAHKIEVPSYFDKNGDFLEALKVSGLPFSLMVSPTKTIEWMNLGELEKRALEKRLGI